MQSLIGWGLLLAVLCGVEQVASKDACGKTSFTSKSGSFATPNYYGKVNKTIDCDYEIAVGSRWVQLKWDGFDVDSMMPYCFGGYVEVYIGCGTKEKQLSKFCSRNADKPHDIFARDGCIRIEYRGVTSGEKGFRVSYNSHYMTTPQSTSRCLSDRNLYSNQGVVLSPGWPTGYKPSYFPIFGSAECEWDLKVSPSRKIKLNFMDVDLYTVGSYCGYGSDRLKVKGKKSSVGAKKRTRTYCRKYPFSLTSKYYEIELEFDGSKFSSRRNRGFVVGYVSYVDKEAARNSKIGMIGGGVVAAIVIGVVIFCCCRRHRRRQAESAGYIQTQPQPAYEATTTTTYHPAPAPVEGGFQQPYPAQPYYPPQPGFGPAPYPPVDGNQPGYPPMEPPPNYPGPPTAAYPPQPAQPYPGQPGAAPYPGQPGAAPYPPPAGYYGGGAPPYPAPEVVDMQKPPVPPY